MAIKITGVKRAEQVKGEGVQNNHGQKHRSPNPASISSTQERSYACRRFYSEVRSGPTSLLTRSARNGQASGHRGLLIETPWP